MSPRPSALSLAVGLALGLAAGLGVAAPAAAGGARLEEPAKLTGVLADRADVLGGRAEDVVAALDRLAADTALDLTVVLVDDFGDWAPRDWADASAVTSSLRQNDGLLAIAVDDGLYSFSLDERFPVAADRLAAVDAEVADLVAARDWAGAATAAADGYRSAWLDAHPHARAGDAGGRHGDGAGPAPFPWLPVAIGAVVLLVAGVVLARRPAPPGPTPGEPPTGPAALPTPELAALAARGLVAVDDAVAASATALAAAQAQLGDVGHFADVLADARRSLDEAFALHHRAAGAADDGARRAALLSVVRLCAEVDAALDARTAGLAALRAGATRAEDPLEDADPGAPGAPGAPGDALERATATVADVAALVEAHRAAVGVDARTHLAAASRLLASARATSDEAEAADAERAAAEALRDARGDVERARLTDPGGRGAAGGRVRPGGWGGSGGGWQLSGGTHRPTVHNPRIDRPTPVHDG